MIHSMIRFLSVCLVALFLLGCGSRINQKNFDKIKTDMTRQQVEAILGKPTETSSMDLGDVFSGGSCVWKNKNSAISIQFVNGKVFAKTFSENKK